MQLAYILLDYRFGFGWRAVAAKPGLLVPRTSTPIHLTQVVGRYVKSDIIGDALYNDIRANVHRWLSALA